MPLLRRGELVDDPFTAVGDDDPIPEHGGVVASLERWQTDREALLARGEPCAVRLRSDQSPTELEGDLGRLAAVLLEFPAFVDGRAYSYARLLRERYAFAGEVRAVGDVLLEQLHYMDRCGFDSFEIDSENAADEWQTASREMDVWYQPTSDGRKTAVQLRRRAPSGG